MEFLNILEKKFDILSELNEALTQVTNYKAIWTTSVILIQKCERGRKIRALLGHHRKYITKVQKLYRAYKVRKEIPKLRQILEQSRYTQLLYYFIIVIQKIYRGYYSRKYYHDYYERKRYIIEIMKKGETMKVQLDSYQQQCLQQQAIVDEQRRKEDLLKTASKLHHLVGTHQQRGVYGALIDEENQIYEAPTVEETPVEDYLRHVVRDLLRTRGISKTTTVPLRQDLHGSKRIPVPLMKSRLSVQASSPYDAIENELKKQKSLHRILSIDKKDFVAGGRTKVLNKDITSPLTVGDPYVDTYANPALMRGVPSSQQELTQSYYDRTPYFVKKLRQPFYAYTHGNKSAVLPNDLFDVIAEAEVYGGTAQRHLGIQYTTTTTNSEKERYDIRSQTTDPVYMNQHTTSQDNPTQTTTTSNATTTTTSNATTSSSATLQSGYIQSNTQSNPSLKSTSTTKGIRFGIPPTADNRADVIIGDNNPIIYTKDNIDRTLTTPAKLSKSATIALHNTFPRPGSYHHSQSYEVLLLSSSLPPPMPEEGTPVPTSSMKQQKQENDDDNSSDNDDDDDSYYDYNITHNTLVVKNGQINDIKQTFNITENKKKNNHNLLLNKTTMSAEWSTSDNMDTNDTNDIKNAFLYLNKKIPINKKQFNKTVGAIPAPSKFQSKSPQNLTTPTIPTTTATTTTTTHRNQEDDEENDDNDDVIGKVPVYENIILSTTKEISFKTNKSKITNTQPLTAEIIKQQYIQNQKLRLNEVDSSDDEDNHNIGGSGIGSTTTDRRRSSVGSKTIKVIKAVKHRE